MPAASAPAPHTAPLEPPLVEPLDPPLVAPLEPAFDPPFEPALVAPLEEPPHDPAFESPLDPPFEAELDPPFEPPIEPSIEPEPEDDLPGDLAPPTIVDEALPEDDPELLAPAELATGLDDEPSLAAEATAPPDEPERDADGAPAGGAIPDGTPDELRPVMPSEVAPQGEPDEEEEP